MTRRRRSWAPQVRFSVRIPIIPRFLWLNLSRSGGSLTCRLWRREQ